MSIITDITNCGRCGKDHKALEFKRLTNWIDIDGRLFTHFAICPTNSEPIIMEVVFDYGDANESN